MNSVDPTFASPAAPSSPNEPSLRVPHEYIFVPGVVDVSAEIPCQTSNNAKKDWGDTDDRTLATSVANKRIRLEWR